jgi:hypothetical protein
LTYFGFELERDEEVVEVFPDGLAEQARRVLAEALAREEARHVAVRRNREQVAEVRELYRRSGGTTPRLGQAELAALYEHELRDVGSMREFSAAPLRLSLGDMVPPDRRAGLLALPSEVEIRGKWVRIEYDVEDVPDAAGAADGATPHTDGPAPRLVAVARIVLPEKLARTLATEELPTLDRPLRFVVHRGQRGAARGSSLEELQEVLDMPWSPEEARDGRHRRSADERARDFSERERKRSERDLRRYERELGGGRARGPRGRPGDAGRPRRRRGR